MPAGDKKASQFNAISTLASTDKFVAVDTSESELRTSTGTVILTWLGASLDMSTIASGGALPVARGGTGVTSFGTGVATWLGTPSSANLAAAVTDETGSGALVFATSPTLVTPALGTPASGTLTSCTGLPVVAGTTGTLTVARGGTGATSLASGYVPYSSGGTAYAASPIYVTSSSAGVGVTAGIGTNTTLSIKDKGTYGSCIGLRYASGTIETAFIGVSNSLDRLVLTGGSEPTGNINLGATLGYTARGTNGKASVIHMAGSDIHIGGATGLTDGNTFTPVHYLSAVNGRVGVNKTAPDDKLHVTVDSTDAVECMKLEQLDVSEGFVNFVSTSAASTVNPLTSFTAGNTIQGFLRVEINGTDRWIPFYSAPTS